MRMPFTTPTAVEEGLGQLASQLAWEFRTRHAVYVPARMPSCFCRIVRSNCWLGSCGPKEHVCHSLATLHRSELMDHPEWFFRDGRCVVIVAHTYGTPNPSQFTKLSALYRFAYLLDLRIGTPAESWYWPGQTSRVELWRAGERERIGEIPGWVTPPPLCRTSLPPARLGPIR